MADDSGKLHQQIGQLQGQMSSMLTAHQSSSRHMQDSFNELSKQIERISDKAHRRIDDVEITHSAHTKEFEDHKAQTALTIARLKWEQRLISAGIAFVAAAVWQYLPDAIQSFQ